MKSPTLYLFFVQAIIIERLRQPLTLHTAGEHAVYVHTHSACSRSKNTHTHMCKVFQHIEEESSKKEDTFVQGMMMAEERIYY